MSSPDLATFPLTPERFADFEQLMGPKGGYGGCWCMLWRLGKGAYDELRGEGTRAAMEELVRTGPPPGVLAYDGETPVGWVSVAPREVFVRLRTSRVLKPVDARPVWSVSCLYIARSHRRKGVSAALLAGAIELGRELGAECLEGYPVAPEKSSYPVSYAWTGFRENFLRAGFKEVARGSPTRPIMRYDLAD
ncbi:GNAT family N-acetyltransferase [Stappia sp.]|uniref:GNAT family N-acetyltransferase n=1 Tax=Stappia sp. TaxID=1870903 RepID=UPI003A99861A